MATVDVSMQRRGTAGANEVAATGTARLAFTASPAGTIRLRALDRLPVGLALPHELRAGESVLGLPFAALGAAFHGTIEVDLARGTARIAEAPAGAPAYLHFRVDREGVVTLRSLDGSAWSGRAARGERVFGIPWASLRLAGEGLIGLDATTLEGIIAGPEVRPPRGFGRERGYGRWAFRAGVPLAAALLAGLAAIWFAGGAGWESWRAPIRTILEQAGAAPAAGTPPDPASVAAPPERPPPDLAREYAEAGRSIVRRGAELAEAYLRHADVQDRIERALALCDGEPACAEPFQPARERAERALARAGAAYLEVVKDAADQFPLELLDLELADLARTPAEGAEDARRRELARRFIAHAAEVNGTDGPEAVLSELALGAGGHEAPVQNGGDPHP